MNRADQITGCLVGGMLGDAIGAQFEGLESPQTFEIRKQLRFTDDTQLTVATCESIIETGFVDAESIAANFLRWFRDRHISGIGSSTLKAMIELDAGGHWAMVGASGERAAGNGAAMRIAPLAFFLDPYDVQHKQQIRDVCRITHRNDEAYIGALAIMIAIHLVINDGGLGSDLSMRVIDAIPDSRVRDRMMTVRDNVSSIEQYNQQFSSSGYVVDSVPLSILAFSTEESFLETVEQLITCGGDTDTVCSMFGQIFGAANGLVSLPTDLIERIEQQSIVIKVATELGNVDVV